MENDPDFHELVDRIYAAAIEPERYAQLVDTWVRRTREYSDANALNAALHAHFVRAAELVDDTASAHAQDPGGLDHLVDDGSVAEMIVTTHGFIETANEAARAAYGVEPGDDLDVLPIDGESAGQLMDTLLEAAETGGEHLIRLNRVSFDGPLIASMSPFEATGGGGRYVLLRCSNFNWTDELDTVLTSAFDLTVAETEIFKFAVDKMDIAEIADARDSTLATVRSQMRAIYEKTGTHGQVELVRLAIGLAASRTAVAPSGYARAVRDAKEAGSPSTPAYYPLESQRELFKLPDGRALDVARFGAAEGRLVLLIHEDLLFDSITVEAQRVFQEAGLSLASCARPGYGRSDPYPDGGDLNAQFADDLALWLDEIADGRQVVVVARGVGLYFAMQLAKRRADMIDGVLGVSPGLPYGSESDFDGLPYICRFILSVALETPIGINFATRAMIAYFNTIGVRRFAKALFGNSKHDLEILEDAELYAVITSSVAVMTSQGNKGFAGDYTILNQDWTDSILECPVPIRLMLGESDTESRWKRVRRLQELAPHISVDRVSGVGGLLYFVRPDLLVEAATSMFDRSDLRA